MGRPHTQEWQWGIRKVAALFRPQRVGGISEIYHSLGPCARLAGTMERKRVLKNGYRNSLLLVPSGWMAQNAKWQGK